MTPSRLCLGDCRSHTCADRCSNHSADFYRMLDELWVECEELMDRGISGDTTAAGAAGFSFTEAGKQLGGSKHTPTDQVGSTKNRAADAALKRKQAHGTGVPRALGGKRGLMHTKSPRELAAAAALRRQRDNLWCGATHDAVNGGGAAAADDDVIDLTAADTVPSAAERAAARRRTDSSTSTAGRPTVAAPRKVNPTSRSATRVPTDAAAAVAPAPGAAPVRGTPSRESWTCGACTFINVKPIALACEVCSTLR